ILEVHEFLEKSGNGKGFVSGSETGSASDSITKIGVTVGGFTAAQLGIHAGTGKSGNAGRTPTGVDRSLQRFSGTFTAPFYTAMKHLCTQQGMTLEADTDALVDAGINLEKNITVTFQEATVEELFQQVAEAGGCVADVRGNRVILRLAE
ncbi:MAG: hypothetical protein Q4C70_13485, partial [Planctomycetia bacterium]|nr:hypothetical protein [Planctomycetia bacterium]